MMQQLFKLFFFVLVLNCPGCQTHSHGQKPPILSSDSERQEQIYSLFMQGIRYHELSKPEQQAECAKVKREYQTNPRWQTAWLLVYALNNDFSCVSLDESLELLNAIQTSQDSSNPLFWLNNNQIELVTNLDKFKKKSNSLRRQLKKAQKRLKKANSKIQALKAIETSINKKFDEEPTKQP